MNYSEALLEVKSLGRFGINPGLSRVKKFLEFLGSPHEDLRVVHVAGTNAKGSVCFMLESVFRCCGYKTGLYTSPSISDYRERICVGGKMISKGSFCRLAEYLRKFRREFGEDSLTEFEALTAMAMKHFSDEKCSVVVLETGMGGRLDATNVIESPLCSVITTISPDHTSFLGESAEEIASEKLGIVKPSCPLIFGGGQAESVYELAEKVCKNLGSKLIISDEKKIKNFKTENFKKSSFDGFENCRKKRF